METYSIIARTNGFIAQRDRMFNGKSEVIIEKGLNYEDAQETLLDMYNEYYENERGYALTLDEAYERDVDRVEGLCYTLESFEYDSRLFMIQEEN